MNGSTANWIASTFSAAAAPSGHLAKRSWQKATWVFCNRCGCSVDTELIHPDGHHYSDDGDFYCADCWGLA